MKDFSDFSTRIKKDGACRKQLSGRIRAELRAVPAASILSPASLDKLVDAVSGVGVDLCLSMLAAYHEWSREGEDT